MISKLPLKATEINLGTNYKIYINQCLGRGAFGEIYKGLNVKTNEEVAIKMESARANHPLLRHETQVLRYLRGLIGVPVVLDYLPCKDYNFMVQELLGSNLEDLFNKCGRKFSLQTILRIGDQTLSRVESLHKIHVIHRDIKPNNFLIGIGVKRNTIYMIDFGLAKKFRDNKTGKHIPYKDGKKLAGTVRYASIYTHLGIDQSRRDDLESLAYTLIYFSNGYLPWQGIRAKDKEEKYQRILQKKINVRVEEICKDLPEEFGVFLSYVRGLHFEEPPDYEYLKKLLWKMFEKAGFEMTSTTVFDWEFLFEGKKKRGASMKIKPEDGVIEGNQIEKEGHPENENEKEKMINERKNKNDEEKEKESHEQNQKEENKSKVESTTEKKNDNSILEKRIVETNKTNKVNNNNSKDNIIESSAERKSDVINATKDESIKEQEKEAYNVSCALIEELLTKLEINEKSNTEKEKIDDSKVS